MAGRDSGPESGPKQRNATSPIAGPIASDAGGLRPTKPIAGGTGPSQGPGSNDPDAFDAKDWLGQTTGEMRDNFARNRRVISFSEYLALFGTDPTQQLRSAGQYLRDVFDHFGTEPVKTPRGPMIRWRVFDCPWDAGKDALVGQEEVQAAVYRLVSNFAREGRTNRLILLHGPNCSAKSTFVACLQRGMEHYSTLDEGALYKFTWIFPAQKLTKGGIGFGGGFGPEGTPETFAYLEDELIESKIADEMRDHPLLLLPRGKRRDLIARRLAAMGRTEFRSADYLLRGDLSHRNRQIFEALLSSYHGDLGKVLRHVQVERFFVSRRYRQAAATVEPQLAVDARSRQLTMDRSLASLPAALQSLTLYEYQGELVDGNRGVIDFADLLKRPLESYKYLLGTVEQGRVSLDVASLELDTVARESDNYPNYEGRTGASPREMKLVIMNAAQSPKYACLSPFAVFDELEELVRGVTVYEFLKQETLPGGFHENRKFVFEVRDKLIDRIDDEVRTSMGLVDERRYMERFERYAAHASYWVKREKVPNPITGRDEDPDEEMMTDVERVLQASGRRDEFRREVISKIGAWSIDHPRQKPDYDAIFPRQIAELRESFFEERKKQVRKINEELLVLLTDGPAHMQADSATSSGATLATLKSRFGYCDHCAKDAVLALIRKRYS